MQSTSAEFLTAAAANPRKCKAKLDIVWTDPLIDSSITVSANDENRAARLSQVHDSATVISRNWAHLDGVIKANGEYNPMPGDDTTTFNQVGWYGATRCNASRVWTGTNPMLTVEFSARPVLALLVVGESNYGEYPEDFDIRLYSGVGGTVLEHTEVVTGHDSLVWAKDIESEGLTDITKMILEVKTWSAASRVVKIAEFYTSFLQTFEDDDIGHVSLLEERVLGDGSLPVGNISANEIDLSLQNIQVAHNGSEHVDPFFPGNASSPYHEVLLKNRRVTPYLGFVLADDSVEYVKLGTFWTGDWKIDEQSAVCSVSARDRMELLRLAEYKGSTLYTDTSLYTLAEAVLTDAKANIPMSDLSWSIDSELHDYVVPYAWSPKQSYFAAIKDIAEACMGQAYMSRDDVLIIEGPSALTDSSSSIQSITKDDYYTRSQPAKSEEIKNRVEVQTQPLLPAGAAEELYSTGKEIELDAGESLTVTAYYSTQPALLTGASISVVDNVDVSGYAGGEMTISAVTYYPWGAEFTIDNIDSSLAGTANVVIEAVPLRVSAEETICAEDADSIQDNGLQLYAYRKNHLVQSKEIAELITTALLSSYKTARKDTVVDWCGNPALELGDVITVPEYERGATSVTGSFKVIRNKLTYDGGLEETTEGRKV